MITDDEMIRKVLDEYKQECDEKKTRLISFKKIEELKFPINEKYDKQQIQHLQRAVIDSGLFEPYQNEWNVFYLSKEGRKIPEMFNWNYSRYKASKIFLTRSNFAIVISILALILSYCSYRSDKNKIHTQSVLEVELDSIQQELEKYNRESIKDFCHSCK